MGKKYLGVNVLEAAKDRIKKVFDDFPKIYLSFSGGKDSGVMLHLVAEEARIRGRKIGVLLVDLEAQYKMTIDFSEAMRKEYSDCCDFFWVCLPLSLRNAVSQFEPQWTCWDKEKKDVWVRDLPEGAITDESFFDFFTHGMEFEDFVPGFGEFYANDELCACFVGIRTQESLNRWRTIAKDKCTFEGLQWTTKVSSSVYNVYPIYDWKTEDIWTYNAKTGKIYNAVYNRMHQAGVTIHQARICQPYGDDQRRGLWLYQILEPETWANVVARVNGANQGALYSRSKGNINGTIKVSKPSDITWEEFAHRILDSMPPAQSEHYKNKIAVFIKWYESEFPKGIPDEGQANLKGSPSWTRICKALLRNDYWCKGLSFSQHKKGAYEKYNKLMRKRRDQWKIL